MEVLPFFAPERQGEWRDTSFGFDLWWEFTESGRAEPMPYARFPRMGNERIIRHIHTGKLFLQEEKAVA